MTEREILTAIRALPAERQCALTRALLAEHALQHGRDLLAPYLPPAWQKWVYTIGAAIVGAVATAALTSCTVSPATAARLQAVDALFHAAAPYIIQIDHAAK